MPQGRLAHIGFAKETTFGTPVAAARYFMFHNETVTTKLEEVIPPQITGFFDEGPSYLGLKDHLGKIKYNVYPDFFGLMLMGYGADVLANGPTAVYTPSTTGGTLATGAYFIKVAAIYGDASGVVVNPVSFIGTQGPSSAESTSQSVTGPNGSIAITITAPTQGPAPVGYIIYYTATGGGAGNEVNWIVTLTTSATITTTTQGGAVGVVGTASGQTQPITAAGFGLHTYSPRQTNWGTNSVTQPFTFEIHRDMTNAWQYTGTVLEKLKILWGVGKGKGADMAMTAESDIIAKTYARIAPTTVTYDALANLFLWNQCKIFLNHVGYFTVQDIAVDIDNGVEGKPYIDGTSEIRTVVAKGPRIVTLTGTMLADDAQFTNYTTRFRQDANVTFTGPAVGATGGFFSLMFDLPQLQIITYPINVPGFQEIMVGFTAKAKFDSSIAQTPALITLSNDVTTQY